LGWVLREIGKRRPEAVRGFLEHNLGRVSRLTLREAVKHLPEGERQARLASVTVGRVDLEVVTGKEALPERKEGAARNAETSTAPVHEREETQRREGAKAQEGV